jgi:2-methylcitrate dehydratase
MHQHAEARGEFDALLNQITDYVVGQAEFADEAVDTARLCLLDSLGCALQALNYPDCRRMIGPVVPESELTNGARVPGTTLQLDPVAAAFNIGCLIRWLDYNDTWLAAEWGHPSDNFGGILAVADYLNRNNAEAASSVTSPSVGGRLTVRDVLDAAIKAYEIQGVLALKNSFNRIGLDHVILVRIASTAVVTQILGGTPDEIRHAISNAFLDGGALRTYRHAPNTGSRKCWAAGDATRRAVQLALWSIGGATGCATALTAPRWGFQDVVLNGESIVVDRPFSDYVMRNILFKVSFPAEFHAQTAAEAAVRLHAGVADRLDEIQRIRIETHESAIRIIDKKGTLRNPSDRDHCLQYITAVALIHGGLTSDHYESAAAADPRIDRLRGRMEVVENPQYSIDYLDPNLRSIPNAVQVFFEDGTSTERIEVPFPAGHRRRREQAIPLLIDKFCNNASTRIPADRVEQLVQLFQDTARLDALPVDELMGMVSI